MRALAIFASAAMVVSLFLSWLNPALTAGTRFVPWDLIRTLDPTVDTARTLIETSPPEFLAFLATFLLAALFLVLAVIGAPSRLLALLTGGTASGLVGYLLWQAQQGVQGLGLPMPRGQDLQAMAQEAANLMGPGAWAWGGGALVLLLSALVGFGARR